MNRIGLAGLLVLSMLVVTGGLATPAAAQGTSGSLPDPITSAELDRSSQRLELSDQQRQAVEAFHEQYRAEFRSLREREIEEFLADYQDVRRSFFRMPDRKELEAFLRQLDRLMGRIRTLDERLFDQVQTVLTEEQVQRLPAVRQARERTRYRSNLVQAVGFFNPSVNVDLSELIREAGVKPLQPEVTEALLGQYERRLTAQMRALYEATTSMFRDLLKRLEDEGFGPDTPPEARRQLFQVIRSAWAELSEDLLEQSAEISSLNRTTAGRLADQLAPDDARRFRNRFLREAYAQARPGELTARAQIDAALGLEALDEPQREAIQATATQLDTTSVRITEKIADLIDERRRTFSPFDFDRQRRRESQAKIDDLRQELADADTQASETLHAILGPELVAALANRAGQEASEAGEGEVVFAEVQVVGGPAGGYHALEFGSATSITLEAAEAAADDEFLPPAISRTDIERFAHLAGLSEDQAAVLTTLHSDYLEAYQALRATHIDPVIEAQRGLWSYDADSGRSTPPTLARVEAVWDLRRRALEAIRRLDRSFFDDVGTLVLDHDPAGMLPRLRMMRQRAVANRGSSGGLGNMVFSTGDGGGARPMTFRFGRSNNEAGVDLTALIDPADLSAEERAAADRILQTYEQAVTKAFQERFENSLRARQLADTLSAQIAIERARHDGSGQTLIMPHGSAEDRQARRARQREARVADEAIASLNRDTLEQLSAALTPSRALALRRAYARQAFPGIYDDPASAEPTLRAAMGLTDLAPGQRAPINELAAEFHSQYDALCDRMVLLEQQAIGRSRTEPGDDRRARENRRNEMERLQFERDELNARILRRLRSILSPEELQRIGGIEPSGGASP